MEQSLPEIPISDHDESVIESTLTEQSHLGPEVLSKVQHNTRANSGSSSEVDHSGDHTPVTMDCINDTIDIYDPDTMTFPYPRYNADAEAHVRVFLNTCLND